MSRFRGRRIPPTSAGFRGAVDAVHDRKSRVHFGVWHPISEAGTAAPGGRRRPADARRGRDGLPGGPQRHGVLRLLSARTRRCGASWRAAARASWTARSRRARAGSGSPRPPSPADELDRLLEGLRRALRFAADQQRGERPARRREERRRGRPLDPMRARGSDSPIATPASTSTRATRWSNGSSRTSGARMRPEVMGDLGGFAGLCALPGRYKEPLLGLVHRRRGHQAEAGVPDRPARHRRDRPGRDERERHGRLRRRAAVLPRLLRLGEAGGRRRRAGDRRHRRRLPGGRLRAARRRDGGAARVLRRRRVRSGRLLRRRRREEPARRRARDPRRRSAAGAGVVGVPLERLLAGAPRVPR